MTNDMRLYSYMNVYAHCTVYSVCCTVYICMYRISGGLFIHAEFNTADPYTWLVSLEILFISWIISQNPTMYDTKLSLLLLAKFNRRFLCPDSDKQNGRKCADLNYFVVVPLRPRFVNTFFRVVLLNLKKYPIVNIVHMLAESHNTRSRYVFIPPSSPLHSIWKYIFLMATKILIK